MFVISGRTADDVWRRAARLFEHGGPAREQPSRGGSTLEVLHVGLTVEEPRERWVVSRSPAINPAFAMVEAFWIASGRRDAALPLFFNPRLSRFCGAGPEYHGAYGYRMRAHFGLDQLDRIYRVLDAAPHTRQAVLQMWDPKSDLPDCAGVPSNQDIPCNVLAMPKVRDGRLEWLQVLRSNDLFLGVPHNIVQFTILQEILAGWLGIPTGEYHQVSDSLHVYELDLDVVRQTEEVIYLPPNDDSLALDRASWDVAFPSVMRRLDRMTDPDLEPSELRATALSDDAPSGYENAIRIVAADAARRRGWDELVPECVAAVENSTLVTMWHRWSERMRSASLSNVREV